MAVERFGDLAPYLAHVRAKVLEIAASRPPEVIGRRPAPERWSVLDNLEHLALTEPWLVKIVAGLAGRGRREGLRRQADQPRAVNAIPVLAHTAGQRFEAPPVARPTGGAGLAELESRLAASRADLLNCLESLEELDTDRLVQPHPLFGWPLNACQWVHFIGLHESRHARQMLETVRLLEGQG